MHLSPGIQSALNAQGPHADAVAAFGWTMFYGAAVVLAVVVVCAAVALWAPDRWRRWMSQGRFVVYAGIAFPGLVLVALLVYSLGLIRDVGASAATPALRIDILAHQWWWRVRYLDASGVIDFVTANELRIPARSDVEIVLRSGDVIHSFWVPALAGKLDVIPGRVNRLRISASRTGVFRGQCAEYCGGPHGQMALYVVAHDEAEFARWQDAQRAAAPTPSDAFTRRGMDLFMQRCAVCHTVRGTAATGELGPDLTHVGSRVSLGAGILRNDLANMAAWISSNQHIKPGNLMPAMNVFSGEDLNAVAAYVISLR